MIFFYAPDILTNSQLPDTEVQHCVRVLRKQAGDVIDVTDGKGHLYKAEITEISPKRCTVSVLETVEQPPLWNNFIEIAVAPVKNMERIEWFAEKAVEIGINKISFLRTQHSERKELKLDRLQKILISAMKQSEKAVLPELQEITDFKKFIAHDFQGQKFIPHCYPADDKPLLSLAYQKGQNALVLIGPEGDFSEEEVRSAVACGFQPVSLGESRLRTETAALNVCQTIHILNQLS
ncbi:ribosomal RNA small subunit methyltransferase E [Bacteroidia bacterium]|nr:ribosomal RNA small subunit methyltransferase E [Bacteroidia bacterium]